MSDMAQTLVTSVARDQILALDDDGRDAVDEVIQNLSAEHGEAIDLPGAPEGTSYLAMRGRGESTPVVIYRAVRGNWLVLSLMTQEEYEDILQLQGVLSDPKPAGWSRRRRRRWNSVVNIRGQRSLLPATTDT